MSKNPLSIQPETKKRKLNSEIPIFYSYKTDHYSCKYCDWKGLGNETNFGDIGSDYNFIELLCPNCHELISTVLFPTHDEVKKYGTDQEKKDVMKRENFLKKVDVSRLKNSNQLVDIISDNEIIIIWDYSDNSNILMYKNVIIWKEKATWESFERFIDVGKILKKKYENKLKDFIPTKRSELYLYGDNLNSVNIVNNFRKSLAY